LLQTKVIAAMNPLLSTALPGVAAPVLFILLAALGLRRWGGGRAGFVLAGCMAAAFFFGSVALAGWPPLPPVTTTQWIGLLALAAGVLAFPAAAFPPVGRWLFRTAVIAAFLWTAARPKFAAAWTPGQGVLSLAAATVLVTGLWGLLQRRSRSVGPLRFVFPLGAGMALGALLFFQEGSLLLAQWAALAALITGAAWLGLAVAAGKPVPMEAPLGVVFPVYGVIAVNALWYTDLPVSWALALWAGLALPVVIGLRGKKL